MTDLTFHRVDTSTEAAVVSRWCERGETYRTRDTTKALAVAQDLWCRTGETVGMEYADGAWEVRLDDGREQ